MNADNPANSPFAPQSNPFASQQGQQAPQQQRPTAPQGAQVQANAQQPGSSSQRQFPGAAGQQQPTGTQPQRQSQPTGAQPTGTQPTGARPTGAQAAPPRRTTSFTGPQPTGTQAPGTQPTGAQPTGTAAQPAPDQNESAGILSKIPFLNRGKDDTGSVKLSAKGGPRKVRVMISSIDPWSAMKMSFLLSIALNIMFVVAVSVLWGVLDSMGVFTTIEEQIRQFFTIETEIDLLQFFEYSRVMSGAIVLGVINTILLTALGTIFGFLYNITSAMVGGVYATLSDD